MEIIALVLVFCAVTMLAYSCVHMGQMVTAERMELGRKAQDVAVVFTAPMDRFISPQRLTQIRLSASATLASVVAGALMFAGVVSPLGLLLPALALGAAGYMAPLWWFESKVRQRKEQFEASILELTIGLEKGLRSGQALAQAVGSMVRRMDGPMKEELTTVLRETNMGKDMVEAMERLQGRMPCEDLMLLVTAIRLTMKSGGSMADVLTRMTEMIRGRMEFQGKLQTLTAQGKFEAIAIMCAPFGAFIVLYMLNTELMRPMLYHPAGWAAFGAVVVLETIGWLIIKRIVTIEV